MYKRERVPPDTYSVQFCCDKCESTTPPLLRVGGQIPEENLPPHIQDLLRRGMAVITGCSFTEPHEMLDYECADCGFGTDMPDDYGGKLAFV